MMALEGADAAVGRGAPPLAEYGLVGDRRAAALVSREGAIDWCCMPRFDSAALFCRLLDWEGGGHCALAAPGAEPVERRYREGTLILETRWRGEGGEAVVSDLMEVPGDSHPPHLIRTAEGVAGSLRFDACVEPRFDYGEVKPWLRERDGAFAAIGGDDGLLVRADFGLERDGRHRLQGGFELKAGERRRLSLAYRRPVELDDLGRCPPLDPAAIDDAVERTARWWREWSGSGPDPESELMHGAVRSALVLKALNFEPTGAIVAAATTSLPEARELGGARNWDYRYAWIRDSALSVRSLAELGWHGDADRFRRFVERSAAGQAADLQVLFGVGGERRLAEQESERLAGYRGAAPVRIGNQAAGQFQLDAFGQLVDQSWRWHCRGNEPDHDYWEFVADLVDTAVANWERPDRGLWEWRGEPRHFVHSKAHAWAAADRGVRLAEAGGREVPEHWPRAREAIRAAVEERGFDARRGTFVQAFGSQCLDAAVLRLPVIGFVDWKDERMVSTADRIAAGLDCGGLLRRYDCDDGLPEEGAFLACSFWLAACLARQDRKSEARAAFDRAAATANDLGLFAEEYDPERRRMLGNLPQALTHLSHIEAALALTGAPEPEAQPGA